MYYVRHQQLVSEAMWRRLVAKKLIFFSFSSCPFVVLRVTSWISFFNPFVDIFYPFVPLGGSGFIPAG